VSEVEGSPFIRSLLTASLTELAASQSPPVCRLLFLKSQSRNCGKTIGENGNHGASKLKRNKLDLWRKEEGREAQSFSLFHFILTLD